MLFHCITDNLSQLTFLTEAEVETGKLKHGLTTARRQRPRYSCGMRLRGGVGPSICPCPNLGCDLIILSRRDDPALVKLLLGSVSNHVVHMPCSVWWFKNEAQSSQQLPSPQTHVYSINSHSQVVRRLGPELGTQSDLCNQLVSLCSVAIA